MPTPLTAGMIARFRINLLCVLLFVSFSAHSDTGEAGEVLVVLLPAAALYGGIFYEQGNEGTLQFVKAYLVSELVTEILKQTVDKERPSGSCCAFPSGHASKAFTAAGFIHERYGGRYGIPAYVAATLVAYSRVDSDHHDEVDVIAGAAIGLLSSRFFASQYEGVSVVPVVGSDFVGLVFEKQF